MKDELIKLLRRAEKDKPYPDELAEEIMELIDAQRCKWTLTDDLFTTDCGKKILSHSTDAEYDLDNMPEYCYGCGFKVEVKDA